MSFKCGIVGLPNVGEELEKINLSIQKLLDNVHLLIEKNLDNFSSKVNL